MFKKAKILLYWARFGGLRLLTLRWQPHKEGSKTVSAFGNNSYSLFETVVEEDDCKWTNC